MDSGPVVAMLFALCIILGITNGYLSSINKHVIAIEKALAAQDGK